jgi:hypothetical protein
VGVPTGTFQITQDITIATGASGDATFSLDLGAMFYYVNATNAAAGTITWSAPVALSGKANAQAIFSTIRPVSAVIYSEFVGATGYDQGQVCLDWSPRNIVPIANVVFTGITSSSFSQTFPVRNGGRILWRPADNRDLEFNPYNAATYPSLTVWASGMNSAAPVGVLRVRLCINYEGIATNETSDFVNSAGPAPKVTDLDAAIGWSRTLTDKITPLFGVMSDAFSKGAQIASDVNWSRITDSAMGALALYGAGSAGPSQRRRTDLRIDWR